MQIKQAQLTDYQSQSLSLANQTVDFLDRIDARRREIEFDPTRAKSIKETATPIVRRLKSGHVAPGETNFEPPSVGAGQRHSRDTIADTRSIAQKKIIVDVNLPDAEQHKADKIEVILCREVEVARNMALRNVEPWRAEAELKSAQNGKRAAESARYLSDESRTRSLENADVRLSKAQSVSDSAGPTKYAQTVRSLRDYAVSIQRQVVHEDDAHRRDVFAKQSVIDLELMVRSVKNLEKGVNGDLPQVNLQSDFDPHSRLAKVKDHLEDKISRINSNQDKRLDRLVEQNTVLATLQSRLGELPNDGVIFFFNKDGQIIKTPMSKPGNILVGVDRLEYPKSKLRTDGTFLNRAGEAVKVEMTYKAIDVPRWKNSGNGPNGAGIDRFAGDDIAGAAIVRPKEGAKPIQANKRVFVEKEVVGLIGDLPADVSTGMAFKELAKRFGNMEYGKKATEATEQNK